MNDYEALFKEKALKDFNLYVEDYVDEIDIDYLLDTNKGHFYYCCIYHIKKNDYKRAIEKLNEEHYKICQLCINPYILTPEDRQKIRDIRQFYKNNDGRINGYSSIRKARTEEIVEEFKQQLLANRMVLIANQNEIELTIQIIKNKFEELQRSLKEIQKCIRKQDIKDFHKSSYKCVCGLEIQKVSKARHERTKGHIDFLKLQNPDIQYPTQTNKWDKQKYKCVCGKEVSNSNKHNHEQSKFHQQYCKSSEPNIVLSIREIS